jgi:hypothetical protein
VCTRQTILLSESAGDRGLLVGRTRIELASAWVRTRCIALMLTTRHLVGAVRIELTEVRVKAGYSAIECHSRCPRKCPAFHQYLRVLGAHLSFPLSLVRPEGIEPPVRVSAPGLQPSSSPSGRPHVVPDRTSKTPKAASVTANFPTTGPVPLHRSLLPQVSRCLHQQLRTVSKHAQP